MEDQNQGKVPQLSLFEEHEWLSKGNNHSSHTHNQQAFSLHNLYSPATQQRGNLHHDIPERNINHRNGI